MKSVLKCSLAYLIASAMVYSPIRKLFGKSENKHLASTVAVYFHPARTNGSMIESMIFVMFSLVYSGCMAAMSMFVSKAFLDWDLKFVGYAIDIIVFCAFGLGGIAFMKQRVNKPTFNTACSVAAIFLVTTLVKEGNIQVGKIALERVFAVLCLVCSGVIISAVICFVLWPKSAVAEFKKSLTRSMEINSEILTLLTESFIDCDNVYGTRYIKLKEEFNSCFKTIHKHLIDAKYELYFHGKEQELETLRDLANSSYKMSLHLNGLGSSAVTQWSLIKADTSAKSTNYGSINDMTSQEVVNSRIALTRYSSISSLHASLKAGTSESYSSLFKDFIKSLGPPMKKYIATIKEILDTVTMDSSFRQFLALTETIEATAMYSKAREEALMDLYQQKNFKEDRDFHSAANEEGAAASCGSFSYLLEEFGNELATFLSILGKYEVTLQPGNSPRTYKWMRFWEPVSPSYQKQVNSLTELLRKSAQDTSREKEQGTWSLKLWRSLHAFRRPDVQYGIKVGLGAALFSLPAFSGTFRPIFTKWRGEWGLITYVIIMNKSVGGTTHSVKIRIFGTFLGAVIAYFTWTAFPKNPYALAASGFVLSIPCFWMILHWKSQNLFGQFILLTFNLTVLYTYSLSISDRSDGDDDDDEKNLIVMQIAFHRFASVCMGVIWALFITVTIFPNTARHRLKRGLSVLWLQMGLVWKGDILATLPRKGDTEKKVIGIQGENLMQLIMIELNGFLQHAPREHRLKGPFPTKEYSILLQATQNILDAFQDISVLVAKDVKASSQELYILEYTSAERAELCNRIFLHFYLLSSAMRLGFPLPDKMPSTDHAIDRMLAKLNEYRLDKLREEDTTNYGYEEDFVLFYSYILVTINITEQLSRMALHIQNLFGVIEDDMFVV